MKVSMSKFYKEVTGSNTANRVVTQKALERWGVPYDQFDNGAKKGDAVDVTFLEQAREKWKSESAERVAKRDAKRASAPLVDDEQLLTLLVRFDDNITAINGKVDAIIKHLKVQP